MADDIVFEQPAATSAGGLFYIVVFGLVLSMTGAIVGFISAKIIGSPFIYLGTMAASIALGVYATKRGKAIIRIVRAANGELGLTVTGPAVAVAVAVAVPPTLEYWYSYFRIPVKHGGNGRAIVVYNVKMTVGDRVIGFKTSSGFEGSERPGWTKREAALGNDVDVFDCPRCYLLPELVGQSPSPAR